MLWLHRAQIHPVVARFTDRSHSLAPCDADRDTLVVRVDVTVAAQDAVRLPDWDTDGPNGTRVTDWDRDVVGVLEAVELPIAAPVRVRVTLLVTVPAPVLVTLVLRPAPGDADRNTVILDDTGTLRVRDGDGPKATWDIDRDGDTVTLCDAVVLRVRDGDGADGARDIDRVGDVDTLADALKLP